jgi:TFIIF-interacting CTD phosphatase-like protein
VAQVEKISKYFDYMFCEEHLVEYEGRLVKDYSKLGRETKRIVIVDCEKPVTQGFEVNHVGVARWSGSKKDRSLYTLTNILWCKRSFI